MSIVIFGKLIVAEGLTAAGSATVWLNWDKIMGSPYRDIVVYAKAYSSWRDSDKRRCQPK